MTNLPPVTQVLLVGLVVLAGVYDLRYRRIPNWLVLPALAVAFGLNTFLYGLSGLTQAALGFGVALLIYVPLFMLRGMGAGDVKLMAAIGALVGWRIWLIIFVVTGLLGGVLALALMLLKGRFRRTLWNTGYIVWEMSHFRAPHMKSAELDVRSPRAFRLPHGVVIALGCLVFLGIGYLLSR